MVSDVSFVGESIMQHIIKQDAGVNEGFIWLIGLIWPLSKTRAVSIYKGGANCVVSRNTGSPTLTHYFQTLASA